MGFLSLDGTFWIQLINFGVFFLLLDRFFLRPVGAAIRQRREYIDGVTNDYERYVAQIRKLDAESAQNTANARREAGEAVAASRAQASDEGAKVRDEYGQRAAGIIVEARRQLRSEQEAADAKLPPLAQNLAGSLLERAVSEA